MQRVTEPELMDDAIQALAYAQADFSEPNALFIDLLGRHSTTPPRGQCLDLGCGPGDICFRLSEAFPELNILAIDGAEEMLSLARQSLIGQQHNNRIQFEHHHLPSAALPTTYFDVITSNSLLHHLHNPAVLWQTIHHCAKPGGQIFIMDLYRPDSERDAANIIQQYAADEAEILKQDFYNSLLAAFTPEEVRLQLHDAGLSNLLVKTVSDRHMTISGQLPS